MAQYEEFDKSSFRSKLLPFEPDSVDIGKSGRRFRDVYAKTATIDTLNYVTLNPPVSGAAFPMLASPDGNVGAPAYSWATETNLGLYRAGAGQIGHSVGGVATFLIAATVTTVQVGDLALTSGKVTAKNVALSDNTLQIVLGAGTLGTITMAALGGARTWTLPDVTGTFITTGNLTSITTVGTIGTGTWQGTIIDTTRGGWGQSMAAAAGVPSWNAGTLGFLAFSNGAYVKSTATGLATQAVPIPVTDGGTNAITLTAHGLLVGEGTSAVVGLTALAKGELMVGRTGADPVALPISTDAFILTLDSAQAAGVKWAAAGGATGVVVKDTVTATTTVSNTTTETTVYTSTRTNELGTTGRYRLTLLGTLKDTSATVSARSMTIRMKLGATTIATFSPNTSLTDGACPVAVHSIGAAASCKIVAEFQNVGATNSQFGELIYSGPTLVIVNTPSALDYLLTNPGVSGTSAVDTTAAQAVAISVQFSTADANLTYTMNSAKLELL